MRPPSSHHPTRHVLCLCCALATAISCGQGDSERPAARFGLPSSLRPQGRHHLMAAPPFPHLSFTNPTAMFEADGQIYVCEQRGHVYRFDNDPAVQDKTLILDISGQTQDGSDGGLLSMAPHPEFDDPESEHHGHLYVYYLYNDDPAPREDLDADIDTLARLSRFALTGPDRLAELASELVLIEQRDRHVWHQGSGLFFHPQDGFLYLGIGDEGNGACYRGNCQRLDNNLYGGVFRIDVDMRGGDISHPIERSPRNGVTDHYYIPNDNPFLDEPDALGEFYAIGLRNPHRMTHDPVDGITWLSDVGHQTMEEVNILQPRANYQWDLLEGTEPAHAPWNPMVRRPGDWTDPIQVFRRDQMRVLIGGHVYRGEAMPGLYGRYLLASYSAGEIWALSYDLHGGAVEVTDAQVVLTVPFAWRDRGISSFGRGQDERLYFLTLGDADKGTIQEILPTQPLDDNLPARLSETGLFSDLDTLTPAAGFLSYDVRVPLWSDGAVKRRWVFVPDDRVVGFAPEGALALPDGTVFLKHFDMALDARDPDSLTRLETRVLVLDEGSLYGLSYRWNEDQSDATLVAEHGTEMLTVTDLDGETRTFEYAFPSPNECLQCHDPHGARSLGFNARQLLPDPDEDELDGVLAELLARDQLDPPPSTDDLDKAARLPRLHDDGVALEDRVRGYLDANCSHCHGQRNAGSARWDARLTTPLSKQHIVDGALFGHTQHDEDDRVIAPGHPNHSDLLRRVRTEDPATRMPPLASARPDEAFIALLAAWIEALGE